MSKKGLPIVAVLTQIQQLLSRGNEGSVSLDLPIFSREFRNQDLYIKMIIINLEKFKTLCGIIILCRETQPQTQSNQTKPKCQTQQTSCVIFGGY